MHGDGYISVFIIMSYEIKVCGLPFFFFGGGMASSLLKLFVMEGGGGVTGNAGNALVFNVMADALLSEIVGGTMTCSVDCKRTSSPIKSLTL